MTTNTAPQFTPEEIDYLYGDTQYIDEQEYREFLAWVNAQTIPMVPAKWNNERYTDAEIDQARRDLHQAGWEYKEDRFYPATDPNRKGWWVHPVETQGRGRGDSKDYWYQTQQTHKLYYQAN